MRFSQLLSGFTLNKPASQEEVSRLESYLFGPYIPPEYLAILSFANGFVGRIGKISIHIYSIKEVINSLDRASDTHLLPIGQLSTGQYILADISNISKTNTMFLLSKENAPDRYNASLLGATLEDILQGLKKTKPVNSLLKYLPHFSQLHTLQWVDYFFEKDAKDLYTLIQMTGLEKEISFEDFAKGLVLEITDSEIIKGFYDSFTARLFTVSLLEKHKKLRVYDVQSTWQQRLRLLREIIPQFEYTVEEKSTVQLFVAIAPIILATYHILLGQLLAIPKMYDGEYVETMEGILLLDPKKRKLQCKIMPVIPLCAD